MPGTHYSVALIVQADSPDQLRELLHHLIEWSNGTAVVTDIRRVLPSDTR